MKTDELIQRLGQNHGRITRLAAPWRRAAAWLGCAAVYVLIVVLVAWVQGRSLEGAGSDVVQQAALIAIAAAAALGAFTSVVPASDQRLLGIPLVPGLLLAGALIWGCVVDWRMHGTLGVGHESDWPCVVSISGGGVLLWAVGVTMLRRGAPMMPRVSGLLVGLAAFSVANIEACLSRAHAFTITIVLWHGMTTMLLVAALALAASRVLTWNKPQIPLN